MSRTPQAGSYTVAGEVAASALLDAGASRLAILYGRHVASFGAAPCWQTDNTIRECFRRPDGERYHRNSIQRVRRMMRIRGWATDQRVLPLDDLPDECPRTPSGKKYPTPCGGTTVKRFNWKAFKKYRIPLTRSQRRQSRKEAGVNNDHGAAVRAQMVLDERPKPRGEVASVASVFAHLASLPDALKPKERKTERRAPAYSSERIGATENPSRYAGWSAEEIDRALAERDAKERGPPTDD